LRRRAAEAARFSLALSQRDLHTIGIHTVEFVRLAGLSRGPQAVTRALDHAHGWIEKDLPLLLR
jgi:hypothetical protein